MIVGLIVWRNSRHNVTSLQIKTEQPFVTTIEHKIVIPGNLFPLTEIEIKSPISGTLEKYYIEIEDNVKIGDRIAQIKLVPDPSKLESAKSNLNSAKINFETQKKIFERNKKLYDNLVIPPAEFEEHQKAFKLSQEQYISAQNQLTLIQAGFLKDAEISNVVKATAAGTIIDLPLKEGSSLIERNNFNNGTTLAVIARLDTFVFKGKVNETDMAYLNKGKRLKLNFNAYKNQTREAVLDKVAAKGIEEQGMMKYYIEAKFDLSNDSLIIRSGYSANAEIVLQTHENILAIKEKNLLFQNDSAYVTIIKPDTGKEAKCFVSTGLSDGVNIEITKGLNKNDKIKIVDE